MKPDVRAVLARLQDRLVVSYGVLSLRPPVFITYPRLDTEATFFEQFGPLFRALADRQVYCLLGFHWALTPHVLTLVTALDGRVRREFPHVALCYLCNEAGDVPRIAALGSDAVFANQNSLLDESRYHPMDGVDRRFDAVYDARLVRWKRHDLAREVGSLALLYNKLPVADPDFADALRRDFARAHWFNHDASGEYRLLGVEDLNLALNQCRVGLCLSAEEGAMYASGQYLLAGLPVVTTPSTGGREVFFDERYVRTVPPDPHAVADAVQDLAARRIDPQLIRRATVARMKEHRRVLIDLVQGIFDRAGVQRRFEAEWPQLFRNRLIRKPDHQETVRRIRELD